MLFLEQANVIGILIQQFICIALLWLSEHFPLWAFNLASVFILWNIVSACWETRLYRSAELQTKCQHTCSDFPISDIKYKWMLHHHFLPSEVEPWNVAINTGSAFSERYRYSGAT